MNSGSTINVKFRVLRKGLNYMSSEFKRNKTKTFPIPAERLFKNELVYHILYDALPVKGELEITHDVLPITQENMFRYK